MLIIFLTNRNLSLQGSKGGLFFSQKEQSPFWNPPKKRLGAKLRIYPFFCALGF
jgi:hypothetical protein